MKGKTEMHFLFVSNMFSICVRNFSAMFSDLFPNGFPMFFPHAPPRIPIHRSLWNAQSSFKDDFDNIELKLAIGLQNRIPNIDEMQTTSKSP